MRKKLNSNEKRNSFIGVKVQSITRSQLNYIAEREATPVSTLIDSILKDYINNYLKIAKIQWDELPDEERGEE